MVHQVRAVLGKLSSPDSAGAYNNYHKAEADAKDNPAAYQKASNAVSKVIESQGYPSWWKKPVEELIARESSYNPNAKNPASSAHGLFQFLDQTRKDYGGSAVDWYDPYQQTLAGMKYIKDRYGDPVKALQFWDKNLSY